MAKLQIKSLQVFRGCAAFAVVAHHAALSTGAFIGLPVFIESIFGIGALGVDFFFVLSGFIIMYAHFNDHHTVFALKHYIFKRLARIYPAYLPVGIAMIVLYANIPELSASQDRHYSLLSSFLLIPADGPPAVSVAWTLVHELMFYSVFLLFFISKRWLLGGLFAWCIVIFFCNALFTPIGWVRYPLSLMNIEFVLGVCAAWVVYSYNLVIKGYLFVSVGIVIAGAALVLITPENIMYLRLVLAVGLALIIIGFAVREQKVSIAWPGLLMMLGNASYSIYLIHNPLLSITQRLAGRLNMVWPFAMLFGIVLGLLAGWVYYLIVEQPALDFFRRRAKKI